MKAKTRHKIEMGARALIFSRAHPDPSPGYIIAVANLEECVALGKRLAQLQITSRNEVHATAGQKRTLLRVMRRAHVAHLRYVARVAQREAAGLVEKFVLPRGSIPLLAFRSAARTMLAEAERSRDLMVRHGLADTMFQSLQQSLEEFDRAIEQGNEAHRRQVGASAGLDKVGDEIVRIVGILDPLNRFRFANAPELLVEWASASHVVAIPRPAAGEEAPAA
jgi:hypothetical protein